MIALIAISAGRRSRATRSRSITTDVSNNPLACSSATRRGILIDTPINISAEPAGVHRSCRRERADHDIRRDETAATHRPQLSHRHTITRHEVALAPIQTPHDVPTVIPKLPLGDLAFHTLSVARVLRTPQP